MARSERNLKIKCLNRQRVITIRCTRSRGPRGFGNSDFRRGPVNVAVIPLNLNEGPMRIHLAVSIVTACLAIGCGRADNALTPQHGQLVKAPNTKLTEAEVLDLVSQFATKQKIEIKNYEITGCHYEYVRNDGNWVVFFALKPPTPPGAHFTVTVDDETKAIELIHGE